MNLTATQISEAMKTSYTSSNGRVHLLGDLPLPYLRNILNKMQREGDTTILAQAVAIVVQMRSAEVDEKMQNRGEPSAPTITICDVVVADGMVVATMPVERWENLMFLEQEAAKKGSHHG